MFGDAELAIATASGDPEALANIFERYADGVYELCRVILRDQREASDAVQDTFVIAATRLGGLREPERLELWLYAIAGREAIRRSTKRARTRSPVDDVLDVPVLDEATGRLIVNESANVVWEAAGALTERERSVLVLNVRHGFEEADLADASGVSGARASVVLSESKAHLALAVRCTSVVRNGRGECAELSAIVPHAHAALDAPARKRVARHACACDHCEPKWNASPDALGVLAAAPPLAAPTALKSRMLNDPRLISASRPLGGGGWRRDGFPPADERPRRRIMVGLAAALIAIAVAVGLVLASDDGSPRLATPGRAQGTTDLTDSSTSSLLAAAPVTATSAVAHTTTTTITTTTAKKRTTTTLRPAGAAPTVTTVAAPVTTTAASVFRISASGPASMTTCAPARFAASTQGGVSPQLYLHYANGGGSGSKNMQRSGTGWYGDLSIPNAGAATWWVSTDPYGRGGTSTDRHPIQVTACPS